MNEQQQEMTCGQTNLFNMNGLAAYSASHYVNCYEFVTDGNKNKNGSQSVMNDESEQKSISKPSRF